MAFSYSFDPSSSPKDEVRFILQDTDKNDPLFQDGEILYFLNQYNQSVLLSAIRAVEVLATRFARLADESVGQIHISYSQKYKQYLEMKKELRDRLSTEDTSFFCGSIDRADKQLNQRNRALVQPKFRKNQFEEEGLLPNSTYETYELGYVEEI